MNIDEVDIEKICISKLEKKEIPGGKGTYYDEYIGYKRNDKITGLYVEFPIMASYGIIEKNYEENKKTTIMFIIDKNDETQKRALEKLDAINHKLRCLVKQKQSETKEISVLKAFQPDHDDMGTIFKNIVFYPTDDDGKKLKDKNPSMFVRMFEYEHKETGQIICSEFLDLNGKTIEWDILKKVNMKGAPIFKFHKLYVGQKIYPFINLQSCVVTERKERTKIKGSQQQTIDRINSENQLLCQQLQEELNKARELRAQYQEQSKKLNNTTMSEFLSSNTPVSTSPKN